jgi:hypothetical protein
MMSERYVCDPRRIDLHLQLQERREAVNMIYRKSVEVIKQVRRHMDAAFAVVAAAERLRKHCNLVELHCYYIDNNAMGELFNALDAFNALHPQAVEV